MNAEVFVSYSRKDWRKVKTLVKHLQAAGVPFWLDQNDIGGARWWRKEIVEAIAACKVLILVLSKSSADSQNVVKEVSLASEKKKHILPLLLEAVDIPPTLQYQLVDLNHIELYRGDPKKKLESVLTSLAHLGVKVHTLGDLSPASASEIAERQWLRPNKTWLVAAVALGLLAVGVVLALLWKNSVAERHAVEYQMTRPVGQNQGMSNSESYQLMTPALSLAASETAQLGLTIWRLRTSKPSDSGPRLLIQESVDGAPELVAKQAKIELVPERTQADSEFQFGDRVFLTLESPAAGYLYVLDREQYSDGTQSDAYLIFPTLKTGGGTNRVMPGLLTSVPDPDDRPNYFLLKPLRPNQVGEFLTVVVTREPVDGLSIGEKPLKLSKEQVRKLEGGETGSVERYEMKTGVGRTWTEAEKEAGANQARLLTQEEPMPQSLFRVAAKPGAPLVVPVTLRYSPRP